MSNTSAAIVRSKMAFEGSKTVPGQCRICGASTRRSNYGALTCDSCKIFFRRNAKREKKHFQCRFDTNCEINIYNRHICSSCRLTKCFTSGMQVDLIRAHRSNQKNITKDQTQSLTASNLAQSDSSTLDSSQRTLLSTLMDNYDERKLVSMAQQFIGGSEGAHSLIAIDEILSKRFLMQIYETSGEYLRSNRGLRTLSTDDRSAFLRNMAENVTCFGMALICKYSQLYNYEPFLPIAEQFYGNTPLSIIQSMFKLMDPDITIAKLALSLFAFSNHTSTFSSQRIIRPINSLAMAHIQDVYAEVTWKYLLHKYGYYQSIERLNRLIQCLLAATTTVSNAQNTEDHLKDIQLLVEQTELLFVVDDMKCME